MVAGDRRRGRRGEGEEAWEPGIPETNPVKIRTYPVCLWTPCGQYFQLAIPAEPSMLEV
jgi:hypothetical protein